MSGTQEPDLSARSGLPEPLASGRCLLLTASCTTGSRDWVLGELWLCPDGLLRRSRGWGTSIQAMAGGAKQTVDPRNRPERAINDHEKAAIPAADKRNRWITWDEIESARLKGGFVSHSLKIQLRDGKASKLEWLAMDGASDVLRATLPRLLGVRFSAS